MPSNVSACPIFPLRAATCSAGVGFLLPWPGGPLTFRQCAALGALQPVRSIGAGIR
jgi:hypothetical protein